MSEHIGFSGDDAFVVTLGPGRTGYVDQAATIDGQEATTPDGRPAKQVALSEFESLCTLRTERADGTDVAETDPVAGHLAPARVVVRQIRETVRDERTAIWFPSLPTKTAPEGDPDTASADVLAALGAVLAGAAPDGWRGLNLDCEALVSRMVLTATVTLANGSKRHWSPPAMVGQWLHRLRMRDYHPGRGVWFRARFELSPGTPLVREVDSVTPPASVSEEDCADELRLLPRNPEAIPRWLLDGAVRSTQAGRSGYTEAEEPGEFELVGLFDGQDESGRPVAYRPVLGERERQAVLEYMTSAPLVLSATTPTPDILVDDDEPAVPMSFHTDGRLVWSGASAYYLRVHGITPPLPLIEQIRARRHQPPKSVPMIVMDRAFAFVVGQPWSEDQVAARADEALIPVERVVIEKEISPRHYSVFAEGENAWCLVRDGDRYRVQWSLDERSAVLFDDVRQAAAYLAGQLTVNAADLMFELDEEIPAWQAPLTVLPDDPPVSAFETVTTTEISNIEIDRYGAPEGNLVFEADTPFELRGLPAEYEQRPYHRYRIGVEPWRVVSVVSKQGGRGYVLPQPVGDYVRLEQLAEITPPSTQTASSAHPGLPPITDAMREEATKNPGGWVYVPDPDVDPRFIQGMPRPVLLGGYKVGDDGTFTGETFVNEDYRPSPRRRGLPEPQTEFELVLGFVTAGWLPQAAIIPAMLNSPFIMETDGNDGLRGGVDDKGRRFLAAYSSPRFVPESVQQVKHLEGRDVAPALAGLLLMVNPGGGFGIELPGDDLAQAAANARPS